MLTRSTPLRRTPINRGTSTLKRKSVKAGPYQLRLLPETPTKRHPRPAGPSLDVVRLVIVRDGGRCVVCGELTVGSRGYDWSIHHRRGRDGKADTHRPQNLILVCGADNTTGCHGLIHQRRSRSQPAGWWISRIVGTDPLYVPLLVERESRWVYLTADGQYADNRPADGSVVGFP